jgi:MGT family glycosyltransferase
MSRIVMAGMPAAGHVNPSVPLVRELVRQNVDVTYYATDEFRGSVERAGAEFRPYPAGTITSHDIAEGTRTGSPVRVVTRILAATESLLPFLLTDLCTLQPAAVVFDSNAIWGRMAAASLRLPMISFMTTMMVGGGELRSLTIREWAHFVRTAVPDLPGTLSARRRVVQRFGKQILPPPPTFPMRGDVTIFPIPRWLQPADPRIDERCHFIGPTIDTDTRNSDLDAELAAHLNGPEPLVLVSLGTLHVGSDDFFRTCFQALADMPVRVLLAVGSHTVPGRLGRPPANTLVRASVPQLEALKRTAVFVTHGGMNSALEGLAHGVPLVVIPQQFEQLVIGQAVADKGAGVVLRHHLSNRPVPPGDLRAAVEHALIDSSQRTSAKAVGETLGEALGEGGGARAGAEVIQSLLARNG